MKQIDTRRQRAERRRVVSASEPRGFSSLEAPTVALICKSAAESPPEGAPESFATLFRRLGETEKYQLEAAKIDIAEEIYLAMEAQQVSRAELARRLGRSRQYVTKILRGNANFTLESLTKISFALGYQLAIKLIPAEVHQPSVKGVGRAYPTTRPNPGLRLVTQPIEENDNERRASAA
jgi:transcriptional regulator with XRE-family HTH domain